MMWNMRRGREQWDSLRMVLRFLKQYSNLLPSGQKSDHIRSFYPTPAVQLSFLGWLIEFIPEVRGRATNGGQTCTMIPITKTTTSVDALERVGTDISRF
jgi:hypothetical protein